MKGKDQRPRMFKIGYHMVVGWMVVGSLTGCTLMGFEVLPGQRQEEFASASKSMRQGILISEVTSDSAIVWIRTESPEMIEVTLWDSDQGAGGGPVQCIDRSTGNERDFIDILSLTGLEPNSSYEVRVRVKDQEDLPIVRARFKTARADHDVSPVKWVWGGDIGGQGYCRKPDRGYDIFDHMRDTLPDFAILLGDLIYADGTCPSPPNLPGSDFVATTPSQFRAKHRYQREDEALQRFLSTVPIYPQWDDHEVRNDFSGASDPLMPMGLEAFQEYWPVGTQQDDSYRLYRQVHRGAHVDLFILDTRQYRSGNTEWDSPQKTMLGKDQLGWLLGSMRESKATWKFIISSVPLSIPKGDKANPPALDSWAQGSSRTGFVHERDTIIKAIQANNLRNIVWISTDVHFAQVVAYDPFREGNPRLYEFVSGPLSAKPNKPARVENSLNPTVLFSDGGFFNFGEIVVDQDRLNLRIIDHQGDTKFQGTLPAQR